MKKRLMAVVMLASLWCGAASGAFAALAMYRFSTPQPSQPSPSSAHKHSCCPGLHLLFTPALFVSSTAPAMPCSEHPCCAKRAPESPASLPALNGALRLGTLALVSQVADPNSDRLANRAIRNLERNFLPSYFTRSTVLRI
jgi:hypothetical protein